MSNETWTEVTADDVKAGDKVRLTFNLDDAEQVVTGIAGYRYGALRVGGWCIDSDYRDVRDTKIERAEPDWTKATLIRVEWNVCDEHYVRNGAGSWQFIGPGGLRNARFSTEEIRKDAQSVTVVLDERAQPVGGDA